MSIRVVRRYPGFVFSCEFGWCFGSHHNCLETGVKNIINPFAIHFSIDDITHRLVVDQVNILLVEGVDVEFGIIEFIGWDSTVLHENLASFLAIYKGKEFPCCIGFGAT